MALGLIHAQAPRASGFGGAFSEGFGNNLGSGLDQLLSDQLEKLQEKRTQEKKTGQFEDFLVDLGFPREKAKKIAPLGQDSKLLQNLFSNKDTVKSLLDSMQQGNNENNYQDQGGAQNNPGFGDPLQALLQQSRGQNPLQALMGGGQQQGGIKNQLMNPEINATQQGQPNNTLDKRAENIVSAFQNPTQAMKEKELSIKKENQDIKKQANIDKYAKPYIESVEKAGSPARHTEKTAQSIIDLMETGKPITGPWGAITPQSLQTSEGQQLITKFADLVLSRAQLGGGVLHKTRLALEELRKPAIWQHPETIKRLAYDIKNDPEIMKESSKAKAVKELEAKWGDSIPGDYKGQVEKRSKEIRQGQKKEFRDKWLQFVESKHPASKYKGQTINGKETGLKARSNGKTWVIE